MKNYIKLIRPSNFIITVFSVFVSCLLAGGNENVLFVMILASLGAGLIGAGGMVINDIYDVEIDRINKPERPLPSGAVTKKTAYRLYALFSLTGVLMNLWTSREAFGIAFLAVPVIFLYSYRLKRSMLIGNMVVAGMTGLAFIYGGAAVGNIQKAIMPALFAFLINAGREIVKDMEDVEGDAKLGAKTFPIRYGMKPARSIAAFLITAVIASTFYPFYSGMYGIWYFLLVNLGVNAVLLYVLYSLWEDSTTENLHHLSTILKYDMLIGLIAIYVG